MAIGTRWRITPSSPMVGHSQRFSLYGDLSIDENIAFQAEIHGVRGHGSEIGCWPSLS